MALGPVDAAGTVDAQTAPTAPWKTLRVFHELPQGILSTKSSTDRFNHPQILLRSQKLSDGTGLVFRSLRGKPLSDITLSRLIKELGIAAVPHGFRSSFRDWAAEQTNTSREVVEAALAHAVRNPTEAAYARSDLFERRRRLMDEWAAYLRGTHGQVWRDDGNRASRPGVLPTLQPTSR